MNSSRITLEQEIKMNSIFLIHLISTVITIFFVVVIWWTNHKIAALNRELIKDSREVLVLNGLLQERMNNIEAKMPGTIWVDLEANKSYTRVLHE